MAVDKKLQEYYENRFDMMASKGWKDLIEDVENLYNSYNQISTTDTFEDYHKRKGQIDILQWILSLKDVSEQTYEELQNEETL
jgi:hypothetical protein